MAKSIVIRERFPNYKL
jgi:hypothetical protein